MLLAISCVLYRVSMGMYMHLYACSCLCGGVLCSNASFSFLFLVCYIDTDYIHLETLKLSLRYSGGIK